MQCPKYTETAMRKRVSFKRLPELSEMSDNSNFSNYLLVSLFVSSDEIYLILKETNFISVF